MDTSKLAALKAPKSTIASRRPMLNSQKSLSALSINTSATHHDLMRRSSSSGTTTNKYRRSSSSSSNGITQTPTPPPPLPTSSNMSPEELSSKIADSFQQFSSMLSQLSTNTTIQKHQRNTNAAARSGMVTTPTAPVTPPPHAITVIPSSAQQQQQQQQSEYIDAVPPLILSPSPLSLQKPKRKSSKKKTKKPTSIITNNNDADEGIDDTKLVEIYSRYAVFNEHYNLDEILAGNTKLRHRLLIKWFNRAASIGDLHTMERMILTTTININETDDKKTGITALMYAAYFGHIQCLKLLVINQKNIIAINQQDKSKFYL